MVKNIGEMMGAGAGQAEPVRLMAPQRGTLVIKGLEEWLIP